ncbi:MAG: glycerophosphodiester phosphodiesterase, partial [[Clostridium] leptum]
PHSALLSKNQVRIAKELGIQVNVWTVDKPKRALTLQGWGCDAVITNTPDVILKALGR